MNQIELTKEHKSKLYEMCKELFPEWTIYKIEHDNMVSGNQWETDEEDPQESIAVNEFSIHWFEFCIDHLSKKVYTINGKIMYGYTYFINNVRYIKKHPVDYLYSEFKKLENGK
jgi:hypothetical protein